MYFQQQSRPIGLQLIPYSSAYIREIKLTDIVSNIQLSLCLYVSLNSINPAIIDNHSTWPRIFHMSLLGYYLQLPFLIIET